MSPCSTTPPHADTLPPLQALADAFVAASRPFALARADVPASDLRRHARSSVEIALQPAAYGTGIALTGWGLSQPTSAHTRLAQTRHVPPAEAAGEALLSAMLVYAPILANTTLTVAEVLDAEYPTAIWQFSIQHRPCFMTPYTTGSEGLGAHLERWIAPLSGLPAGARKFHIQGRHTTPLTLLAAAPEDALALWEQVHPGHDPIEVAEIHPLSLLRGRTRR